MKKVKNKLKKCSKSCVERIVLGIFILLIISAMNIIFLLRNYVHEYTDIIQYSIKQRLSAETRVVASMLDPAEFAEFVTREDAEKPRYQEITLQLAAYAEQRELEYIYVARPLFTPEGLRVQYFLDADLNPETRYELDYISSDFGEFLERAIRERKETFNLI